MHFFRFRHFSAAAASLGLLGGLGFSSSFAATEKAPVPSPQAASPSSAVIDRLEASVNGALVLQSDIAQFRKTLRLRQQLDPLFTGTVVANEGASASNDAIVQFLIDEKIISQQFPVTEADVEQEINSIQSNNHIDRNSLKAALHDQGFRFEDYFELIRSSASKRNLIDRDVRSKATVTDEDVKNYFLNHYSQDAGGERSYSIQIILVSPKSYKTVGAAHDVATKALAEIKSGDSFDEVAKRVSDDASANSGGDLGSMTEDQMSPLVRQEVKRLSVGQVSPVIGNGKSGFMIVKLVDVKTGESARLIKLKDEIRQQLIATEYQHQIQLWLQRQRQASFIHIAGQPNILGIPGSSP
ncbi:MAG: peptidylprolyl isomerase [Oligoflexia bacterium]|nr:peptidylprolyl isomerase [Oligoflexia bacterium]